jgi:hypothetical protein
MKILLAALILFSAQAKAATFESLTEKALQEGTVTETAFGFTKSLERRMGSQVIYFTIDIDPQSGNPKRFSAVVENWQKTPEGKYQIDQNLFWFTPLGELAVTGHFLIVLKEDKSFESRKEISYGEAPQAADLDQWNNILATW